MLDDAVSSPGVPWEGVQRPREVFGNFGGRWGGWVGVVREDPGPVP